MINLAVNILGGHPDDGEIKAYIDRAAEKYPYKELLGIDINASGDYVELTYHWRTVPFERIKRIK
ncbi:MAG: hypothetical protein IKI49_05825 [Oscillospiraceae bacterium]|nr:hypothetical protein [Oscillospiraceae bacterium]